MKRTPSVLGLIVFLLLCVGCAASDESSLVGDERSEPEAPAEQLLSPSANVLNAFTPTATSSLPVTRMAQPTHTPSPAAPPTATAPLTPTPGRVKSTLSREETTENLVDLLQRNNGCELPCWWGIVPGETRVEAIESTFVPLGFDWHRGYEELQDNVSPYKASIYFTTQDSVVQVIEVKGGATEETYDRNEAWRPYAIPRVLERLGSPEQVYVYYPFRFDPGGMQAYRLFMVYPDRGVEIDYLGKASLVDERPGWARACPDILETDAINLLLYAPGSVPDYLERSLPRSSIPVASGVEGDVYELISWEQATGGTLAEFVQLFTEHEEGAVCFDFQTYWTGRSD